MNNQQIHGMNGIQISGIMAAIMNPNYPEHETAKAMAGQFIKAQREEARTIRCELIGNPGTKKAITDLIMCEEIRDVCEAKDIDCSLESAQTQIDWARDYGVKNIKDAALQVLT